MGRIVILLGRETEAAVVSLLALSLAARKPGSTAEDAKALADEYATRETHALWGYEDDNGDLLGLTGIEWNREGHIRLQDLAVGENAGGAGIGRRLIDHLRLTLHPIGVAGVCYEPLRGYFEGTGFEVDAFDTDAAGEQRYRFRWRPA